jgi:hypothetical protein
MDIITFEQIVFNQREITDYKTVLKCYMEVSKLCGRLNLKGYNGEEYNVTPIKEHGEIRLIQDNDTYSNYIKINPKPLLDSPKISYGICNRYLVKNIGEGCYTVYELKSVTQEKIVETKQRETDPTEWDGPYAF